MQKLERKQSIHSNEIVPKVNKRIPICISEYCARAIIGRSRFEAALIYKPRILSLKNEEFPFFST